MKLMIVDDSKPFRMLLETFLRAQGRDDLVITSSAREAIDHLQEVYAETGRDPVDLIIMDNIMPGMNGIEATRAIKSLEGLKDIPIIVVTGQDDMSVLENAFQAGAIDYINKPINKIELKVRVNSVLKLKEEMDHRKAREKELEELTRELEKQTRMDGLTGVPNRRFFDETFQKEWARLRREERPLCVLMIDIDYFKLYNDTYGHIEGDACLRKVAEAINQALMRPGDFMARYGGEEFVVILPETAEAGGVKIAEKIRRTLDEVNMEHSASLVHDRVTVSIGVAGLVPTANLEPRVLLAAADQALYQAKEKGRNQVVRARAAQIPEAEILKPA